MNSSTFPEPRKPVITVAGILSSGGSLVETSELSACAGAAAAVNLRENRFDLGISMERILGCVTCAEMERKFREVWWHLGLHKRGKTEVLTLLQVGYFEWHLASPTKAAAAMSSEIEAMAGDLYACWPLGGG